MLPQARNVSLDQVRAIANKAASQNALRNAEAVRALVTKAQATSPLSSLAAKYVLSAKPAPQQAPAEKETPFMAEKETPVGTYYGAGLRGFARGVFGNLFDPKHFLERPTKEQKELLEAGAKKGAEILNERLNWDKWIGKWFSAEDVSKAATAVRLSINTPGEAAAEAAELTTRGVKETLFAGLSALGILAKAAKKTIAAQEALEEIGRQGPLPDVQLELPDEIITNKAAKGLVGQYLESKGVLDFNGIERVAENVVEDLAPPLQAYRWLSAAASVTGGYVSMDEAIETFKRNVAGSEMIYTKYYDTQRQEEFKRRVLAGESPDFAAFELQNPWVEAVGEMVIDPANLLGAKIPFTSIRLPGVSEILGLNIGRMRLLNKAEIWSKPVDEISDALRLLDTPSAERQAAEAARSAAARVKNALEAYAGDYGIFSPMASGKAEIMKDTVGTFFGVLAKGSANSDELLENLRDVVRISRGQTTESVIEGLTRLRGRLGNVPLSRGGLQAAAFIGELWDSVDIPKIVRRYGNDTEGLIQHLDGALRAAVDRFFPDVEQMEKAHRAYKAGDTGADVVRLAKKFEALPLHVKISSQVFRRIDSVYRPFNVFFAAIYMGYNPAYSLRNIYSNTIPLLVDLGAGKAVSAAAEGLAATAGGNKAAEALLAKNRKKITRVLGFVPETAQKGTAIIGKGGNYFTNAGARGEAVMSSTIVRVFAEEEMEKVLRSGAIVSVNDMLAAGLDENTARRLFRLLVDNYGDYQAAVKALHSEIAGGFVETFRTFEIPERFKGFLRSLGLLDELEEIRAASKTPDEFMERMRGLSERLVAAAEKARQEVAAVGKETEAADAAVLIQTIFKDGILSAEEADQFTAVVQGWQYARNLSDEIFGDLWIILSQTFPSGAQRFWSERTALDAALRAAADQMSRFGYEFAYPASGEFLRGNEDIAAMLKKAKYALTLPNGQTRVFSMAEAYAGVDWSVISKSEFIDMFWKWVKTTQQNFWSSWNVDYIMKQDNILRNFASAAGADLDALVRNVYAGRQNKLEELRRALDLVEDWETWMPLQKVPEGVTLGQMNVNTARWRRGDILKAVNKDRAAKGLEAYKDINEVPFSEAVAAWRRRVVKPIAPPVRDGNTPSVARQLADTADGWLKDIEDFTSATLKRWGEKTPVVHNPALDKALGRIEQQVTPRMAEARARIAELAKEFRNFALHDYNKTYFDKAMGYLSPYGWYWSSRTYARWFERAVDTPGALAAYAKYREAVNKANAELPEWWRYNLKIPIGASGRALFFNFEASFNPLNGLTGIDFNDPYKRVDWFSSVVDDMGKFGPTMFTPFQWLMALYLYEKGEKDAAVRWMGRLFPQSQAIKALATTAGVNLPVVPHNETDPFVLAFSDGVDPYEQRRVGRVSVNLLKQGYTPEQINEAMYFRKGELWDKAVQMAVNERGMGTIASFLLGVGVKPRTAEDMRVDMFYNDYYALLARREFMTPEEYRREWDDLREEYPFMDSVLLSKKNGADVDSAYAYNVLGRIPPGSMSGMFEAVGIDSKTLSRFYDNKGDMTSWSEGDRRRFMAAIIDMGALLKMPNAAVKEEWNAARAEYSAVSQAAKQRFGSDIEEKIAVYYGLLDNDRQAAYDYLDQFPEVSEALSFKNEMLISNPILYKYYGSIEDIQRYYNGLLRKAMSEKFGRDIFEKYNKYYELKLTDPKEAKKYYKEHPELKAYSEMKAQYQDMATRAIVRQARYLETFRETGAQFALREDLGVPTEAQAALLQQLGGKQEVMPQELISRLSRPMLELVQRYYDGRMDKLPYEAMRQLDYIGRRYGLSDDEVLQLIGIGLSR